MRRFSTVMLPVLLAALLATSCSGGHSGSSSSAAGQVQVWLTTPDKSKLLQQEESLKLTKAKDSEENVITIDDRKVYQQMDGFGASLTDSSAWLIANKLNDSQREELMNKLFDHEKGIGISYMRVPLGASDFAVKNYTFDDMPSGQNDPELKNFSIDHDKEYIIPTLQQALKINPDLKLMGSPWSAPGWMKTTDSVIGGSLKPDAYEPFANYFVKMIQGYEAEGVPFDAITLQNEPHYTPEDYPGMRMEPVEQAELIKNFVGPAFEKNNIKSKIVVWDHNWDEPYYPLTILNDPDASKYVDGTAFHGYAGEVGNQAQVHEAYPDKNLYFTESSGGAWSTDFGGNLKWDMENLIIGATRNWSKVVLKWNLALDENYGPTIGGCKDCMGVVTINQGSGDVTFNSEYYSFGHASKFVKSGAYRIESGESVSGEIEQVAFKNPDGSIVLVALNAASEDKELKVKLGGKSFAYTMPAGAVATFVWPGTANSK
ncbi:glycoside hydrolase family 30 beta sandwich domain-containing protein [Paenibacillus sp. ATY16]|uniref:glycoside hydrolase family 30 protein n=1 Tax=Paenibacillus sp. ATY16 TaxID=1759312 RepID=UPI00200FCD12|nr:glycoside hydrolase family 30 beta sandwich domain-containing protein [Paenibacillus sp. ATY16]MCK9859074.1 glycosyl hydrolase [Paenibacillus sp. ATY16]